MRKSSIALPCLMMLSLIFYFGARPGFSCSTFVLKSGQDLIFGRNWDFFSSRGMVVINQRNVAKMAFLAPTETPAAWVSKYGSITFNQIGKEFAFGGMNEKGLVIEMMWLDETGYPQPDERPAVMELQWIQYQLDNFSTVKEVIDSDSQIRISQAQSESKQHYLICDRQGNAAAIEFIEGELVCHTGDSLPATVLTNSTYDESLEFHRAFDTLSLADKINRTSLDSRERFAKIARRIKDFQSGDIKPVIEYAFDILGSVSVEKFGRHCTAWSIVYDVNNMRIYFKTFENRNIRFVDFKDFDFECSSPSMVLEITSDLKGDISKDFVQYTPEMNKELISTVMAIYQEVGFMGEVPVEAIEQLSSYPSMVMCK